MNTTRIRPVAFLAFVTLLVFAVIGVAYAHESRGSNRAEGPALVETHLQLATDVRHVAPGGIVTLTGKLTAEPTETVEAEDGDGGTDVASTTGPRSTGLACYGGYGDGDHHGADSQDETPTPLAGVDVAIFQRTGRHTWSQVGTATTDADGAFSATETVDSDTVFRAVFAGDDVYARACSRMLKVKLIAEVTAPVVTGTTVHANKHFHVKGIATRGAGKVTVTVYKRSGGRWTAKVASVRASVSAGVYTATLKLRGGTYRIGASQAGNSRVHGASSAVRGLKVAGH